MRIAYLSTFYPFRGGIAQFNALLYKELADKHDAIPYTFLRQYPDFLFPGQTQYVQEGDTAEKIDSKKVLDTANPLSYVRAAKKIAPFKPDLLLTKFWMPYFAPSLGKVAKHLSKSGTKSISILDNVIPHETRPGDISLIKYFLKANDAFVVMSDTVKDDLLKLKPNAVFAHHPHPLYDHFGLKMQKVNARKAMNIPEKSKVLLFFGFIRDYKGLDLLLQAIKQLPEDYFLLIAGEVYGSFDKYEEMINRMDIRSRVGLNVRYIGDDEVSRFFSVADACVLPYKSATQSGIVGISYHFDLPVIATDVGGLKEMIEPFGTGAMIKRPNANDITTTIKEFFESGNSASSIENIQQYKKQYNWKTLADSIENLYDML